MSTLTFEPIHAPFWQATEGSLRPHFAVLIEANDSCIQHPALLAIDQQSSDSGQFAVFDGRPIAVDDAFATATASRRLAAALDVCHNLTLLHEHGCSPRALSLNSLVFEEGRLLIVPVGPTLTDALRQYDAHRLCATLLEIFGGRLGETPASTNDHVLNGLLLRLSQSTADSPALEPAELMTALTHLQAHHQQRNTAISFNEGEPGTKDESATRVIDSVPVSKSRKGLWLSLAAVTTLGLALIAMLTLPSTPKAPVSIGVQINITGLDDSTTEVARTVLEYQLVSLLNESSEFTAVSARQLPSGVPEEMIWRSLGTESGITATLNCVSAQECQLEASIADINNQLQKLEGPVRLSYNAPDPVQLRALFSSLLATSLALNDQPLGADDYALLTEADAAISARSGLAPARLEQLFALAETSQSPLITRKLLKVLKDQNDATSITRFGELLASRENTISERDHLSLSIAYEVYLRRNTNIQSQLNRLGVLELHYGIHENDVLTRAARHFYLNDPQSAYNELVRAIEISPSWRLESAAVWYASAVLANFALVERHVESLLRFQPNNQAIRRQQLNVAIPRARLDWLYEGAQFFADQVDQRNQALAWIAIYNGDWEQARQLMEAAYLQLNSEQSEGQAVNAYLTLLYADTLRKTGDTTASMLLYDELLRRYYAGDIGVTRATAMQSLWHTQSAETAIVEFIDNPDQVVEVSIDLTHFLLFQAIDHPDTAKLRERCLAQGFSERLLAIRF
ncbi:hypothetical protein [uncultured Umboniibacter sp.]|uniref:hypothetical protein n=1 Tax=uncultured Umboniibacter sp. TaxID=1798917 RepID=UPI002623F6B4|nr:hypothetical protein [uncultured Umboniibacter sp.]